MQLPIALLKTSLAVCLFTLLWGSPLSAQEFYRPLDTLDRNFFFAGVASNILPKDKFEIISYGILNSYWLAVHESAVESPVRDRLRFTNFITNIEGYYGFSSSRRWDLGLRLQYARARLDNEARSPATRVFQSPENEKGNMDVDKTYSGVTGLGLRLRVAPIGSVPELMINGGYTQAGIKSEETQRNLFAERDYADLNVTYFLQNNPNAYYYFIANGTAYFPSETNKEVLYNVGGSFFLVHLFSARRLVIYPGLSYNILFKPPEFIAGSLIKIQDQVLGFAGIQYQPVPSFSINSSIAYPFLINTSALATELVKESYSYISIGIRVVI